RGARRRRAAGRSVRPGGGRVARAPQGAQPLVRGQASAPPRRHARRRRGALHGAPEEARPADRDRRGLTPAAPAHASEPGSGRAHVVAEARALVELALPVVTAQLGLMLLGVVDTIMVGHLSKEALGAVALGNLYTWGLMIVGNGILLALDPVIA